MFAQKLPPYITSISIKPVSADSADSIKNLGDLIYGNSLKVDPRSQKTKTDTISIDNLFKYNLEFKIREDYSNSWNFYLNLKKIFKEDTLADTTINIFDFTYDEMKKAAETEYLSPGGAGLHYYKQDYQRRDRFETEKILEIGPFIFKAKYSILFIYNVFGWDKTSGILSFKLYEKKPFDVPNKTKFFDEY